MKKVSREIIEQKVFGDGCNYKYFHVEQHGNMYYVVRDADGLLVAWGKELKGYVDDIIYSQYDGDRYGTGNYYLKSDRHGIICKCKE